MRHEFPCSSLKDHSLLRKLCALLLTPLCCWLQLSIWILFSGCDPSATYLSFQVIRPDFQYCVLTWAGSSLKIEGLQSLKGCKRKPSLPPWDKDLPTYLFLAVNDTFAGYTLPSTTYQGKQWPKRISFPILVCFLLLARCAWPMSCLH